MAEATSPVVERQPATQETADSQQWTLPSMFTLSPEVAKQQQALGEKTQGVLGEMQAGTQTELARRQAQQQAMGPVYDQAAAAVGQPLPEPPEATQYPEPPGGPLIDPEQFKQFFGPMWIFSILLGKVARGDMVDGLNMLSAGMKGYVQGSEEKFKHGLEQWKAKTEKALNEERAKLVRYRQIIESKKWDIQAKMQMLSIEAMREDDKRMQFALQQQNWAAALKAYEVQSKMLNQQGTSAINFYGKVQTGVDAMARQKSKEEAAAALQKEKEAAKLKEQQTGGITPETAKRVAEQVVGGGDRQAMIGYARSPKNMAIIQNAVTEEMYTKHMTGPDLAAKMAEYEALRAGMRAAGTRGAQIGFAAHELDQFTKIALKASAEVPRAGFVPINKLYQMGSAQWSPEQAAFVAANRSVINAFAQLASRGVPTVHNTEEAEKMLYTAQTEEQYKAVSQQLITEADGAVKAANAVLHNLSQSIRKGAGPEQQAPQGAAKPSGGLPRPKTVEEAKKLAPGTRFVDPDGVERTR